MTQREAVALSSLGVDYLIMKMGNKSVDLLAEFLEDIAIAKELEEQALTKAYDMGMYEQDRLANLCDTEEYMELPF